MMVSARLHRYEPPPLCLPLSVAHIGTQLDMICADRCAADVLADNIVSPSLPPAIHISCSVLTSSKAEFNFTAIPNPYNGFDRTSNFPVTVSLNNARWSEDHRKMLTPTKGSIVKVTGVITSVYVDDDGVNHWMVTASEIYFLKDPFPASKPTAPGTGKSILYMTTCTF